MFLRGHSPSHWCRWPNIWCPSCTWQRCFSLFSARVCWTFAIDLRFLVEQRRALSSSWRYRLPFFWRGMWWASRWEYFSEAVDHGWPGCCWPQNYLWRKFSSLSCWVTPHSLPIFSPTRLFAAGAPHDVLADKSPLPCPRRGGSRVGMGTGPKSSGCTVACCSGRDDGAHRNFR